MYRDTDLMIATLAARVGVKPYLISQVMGVCIIKLFRNAKRVPASRGRAAFALSPIQPL